MTSKLFPTVANYAVLKIFTVYSVSGSTLHATEMATPKMVESF